MYLFNLFLVFLLIFQLICFWLYRRLLRWHFLLFSLLLLLLILLMLLLVFVSHHLLNRIHIYFLFTSLLLIITRSRSFLCFISLLHYLRFLLCFSIVHITALYVLVFISTVFIELEATLATGLLKYTRLIICHTLSSLEVSSNSII